MTRTQLFTPMREGGGLPEEAGAWIDPRGYSAQVRGAPLRLTGDRPVLAVFYLRTPQGRFAFGCYVAGVCGLLQQEHINARILSNYEFYSAARDFWLEMKWAWQSYARGEIEA